MRRWRCRNGIRDRLRHWLRGRPWLRFRCTLRLGHGLGFGSWLEESWLWRDGDLTACTARRWPLHDQKSDHGRGHRQQGPQAEEQAGEVAIGIPPPAGGADRPRPDRGQPDWQLFALRQRGGWRILPRRRKGRGVKVGCVAWHWCRLPGSRGRWCPPRGGRGRHRRSRFLEQGLPGLLDPGDQSLAGTAERPGVDLLKRGQPCLGGSVNRRQTHHGLGNTEDAMRIAEIDRIDPEPFPTGVEGHVRAREGGRDVRATTRSKPMPFMLRH
jgi:hypothetical protein